MDSRDNDPAYKKACAETANFLKSLNLNYKKLVSSKPISVGQLLDTVDPNVFDNENALEELSEPKWREANHKLYLYEKEYQKKKRLESCRFLFSVVKAPFRKGNFS